MAYVATLLAVQIFTWNTDAWGYNENTTSLYQSHPWVFAILPNGEAFGVLADTSCRCEVNFLGGGIVSLVLHAWRIVLDTYISSCVSGTYWPGLILKAQ
jgi:hypothetical protein